MTRWFMFPALFLTLAGCENQQDWTVWKADYCSKIGWCQEKEEKDTSMWCEVSGHCEDEGGGRRGGASGSTATSVGGSDGDAGH